jgi:Bacterial aa3 type cytochrome c oxidase subunit IV
LVLLHRIPLPDARNYAKPAAIRANFVLHNKAWRNVMADHGEVEYATATGNDLAAHEATYYGFITLVKSVLAAVVVIVVLMAIFLV